jgi:hypothetical protein
MQGEARNMSREKNEKSQMKSYGILLMDDDIRPVSNCCGADPKGNVHDGVGRCADCGEFAEFESNHED